jgi:pSer/pThr/pTyr-binding forkhead associated (FHA) protein
MSVGGLVVFALGLVCGVGLALYIVRAGSDSTDEHTSDHQNSDPAASSAGSGNLTFDSESTSEDGEPDAAQEWLDETLEGSGESADEAGEADSTDTFANAQSSAGHSATSEEFTSPQGEPGDRELPDTLQNASSTGELADEMMEEMGGRNDDGSASESGPAGDHWLEGLSGSVSGKTYQLDNEVSVGRLPRNDLQLSEGDVSRVHCRFRLQDGAVMLEALDTVNGTRINDADVAPGEPTELKDGDVVEIGNLLVMYHRQAGQLGPDGLADESSDHGIGIDARTVTVDTGGWRERIVSELELSDGDIDAAAQALGMDVEALERLTEQLDIDEVN